MQIDVVITSCSCFAPTPSMAAMILNRFKMRSDVLTYSLSGMGCSSSIICIDLAKHLLQVFQAFRLKSALQLPPLCLGLKIIGFTWQLWSAESIQLHRHATARVKNVGFTWQIWSAESIQLHRHVTCMDSNLGSEGYWIHLAIFVLPYLCKCIGMHLRGF
jgi:FAE1/Type III polyketide synthase-like protein